MIYWRVLLSPDIGTMARVSTNGPGDQYQVEPYQRPKKWYLKPFYLTLSNVRYGSRVKGKNIGNGVAPSPKTLSGSYRKGSRRVILE